MADNESLHDDLRELRRDVQANNLNITRLATGMESAVNVMKDIQEDLQKRMKEAEETITSLKAFVAILKFMGPTMVLGVVAALLKTYGTH